jgi:Lon protease-like protein
VPALGLQDAVMFPGATGRVAVETLKAHGAIVEATRGEGLVAVFGARRRDDDLFPVGVMGLVRSFAVRRCCGRPVAELAAVARVRVTEALRQEPFRILRVERLAEPPEDPAVLESLVQAVHAAAWRIFRGDRCAAVRQALARLESMRDPLLVPGAVQPLLGRLPLDDMQRALELPLPSARLCQVLHLLHARLERAPGRPATRRN